MSYLNQSAIRKHALACSVVHKGGRFTRTGQDFIDEVEADVEAIIRELRAKIPASLAVTPTKEIFVTGALTEKLKTALNEVIARVIQNKVARQPTCGQTLGRTR